MDDLEELTKISRFVTIAKSEGGIIVEANLWLNEKTMMPPYTVNIRGWGKTIESAAEVAMMKVNLAKTGASSQAV